MAQSDRSGVAMDGLRPMVVQPPDCAVCGIRAVFSAWLGRYWCPRCEDD